MDLALDPVSEGLSVKMEKGRASFAKLSGWQEPSPQA
jgi:hypothetical protein